MYLGLACKNENYVLKGSLNTLIQQILQVNDLVFIQIFLSTNYLHYFTTASKVNVTFSYC